MPCIHGNCSDDIHNYTCECFPGYTGINYEDDIDECASRPCYDAAYVICLNEINEYICLCGSLYSGLNCEGKVKTKFTDLISDLVQKLPWLLPSVAH